MSERLETIDGLQDSDSAASSKHSKKARPGRTRKQMLAKAFLAPGLVTLRAGAKAVHGVGRGVNATISKGKAGVSSAGERKRERKDRRISRREAAIAQENDPFSITETPVERTARMQAAPKEQSLSGARATAMLITVELHESEGWCLRQERVRRASVHREIPGWQLAAVIVKADDDLRQEMFCMHLITIFRSAFRKAGIDALVEGLRPFSVQSTSGSSGLIEALVDATSIAETKRRMLKEHNNASLDACYKKRFGGETSVTKLKDAQRMCMHSVAAYAIVQSILHLKDRHNGNILIDSQGRMVHIDFTYAATVVHETQHCTLAHGGTKLNLGKRTLPSPSVPRTQVYARLGTRRHHVREACIQAYQGHSRCMGWARLTIVGRVCQFDGRGDDCGAVTP